MATLHSVYKYLSFAATVISTAPSRPWPCFRKFSAVSPKKISCASHEKSLLVNAKGAQDHKRECSKNVDALKICYNIVKTYNICIYIYIQLYIHVLFGITQPQHACSDTCCEWIPSSHASDTSCEFLHCSKLHTYSCIVAVSGWGQDPNTVHVKNTVHVCIIYAYNISIFFVCVCISSYCKSIHTYIVMQISGGLRYLNTTFHRPSMHPLLSMLCASDLCHAGILPEPRN